MYGEYVILTNSEQRMKVCVNCTPDTSRQELVKRAKKIVANMN